MGKKFRDMSPEEKAKVYARTERYRKKNMQLYRDAAKRYAEANPEKTKEQGKKWREGNKEYLLAYQREAKRSRKLEAIVYLGGKCSSCGGVFHPAVYEFHHLDPSTKERDPSKLLNRSREVLYKELDKCVLLCANCHRLEHHKGSYSE